MSQHLCPCGSLKVFQHCCQPLLTGSIKALTPEALMRSRYTAFCQGHIDYLIATLYPAKRQANDVQSLQTTINETDWLGLKVIKTALPKDAGNFGFVEFAAFYQRHGFGQLHELSEFIRENGQWYYLQGKLLAPITLKRNELCWCGSGKKYKRCHG